MTYTEATDWMFAQLPMYQRQGKTAFKKDLTNTIALAEVLGNPERKFKAIHVGGTNGKGSTSHMLASILQEEGYTVGLYTSPHLKRFTERIKINGEEISEQAVIAFVQEYQAFLEQQKLSFFEMTVGMAFLEFAKQEVDIAIVEVGLGGRLDSTNIILPEVSVITNIGLDHTQFLGETLAEIAYEKAGIIKPNVPVVIGERQEETASVFIEKAKACNAEICFASDSTVAFTTDLQGTYQAHNVKTAIAALDCLQSVSVSENSIVNGLLHVVKNTGLKGRWQILQESPKIICDTAHNKEGLGHTMAQLKGEKYQHLHVLLGMVKDKKIEDILPLFPKKATYYFCKPAVPRGLCEIELKEKAKKFHLLGDSYASVAEAVNILKLNMQEKDIAYIGGSTFVVAEVL
ncbi:folylpolyglutamate synthase/dihydrofolate synthase family protein [Tenacibaculum sp. SG-28]|uniref:bifunctional folylpolyglutamate synthase/dihydrofolate synthase n=1 Tax=Tenacibaculum sp. SG-28 TaxID=754426 RepID=UPI000CF3B99F|nr:folylpolyglutamate synthase/dihydrofolate synthase family protein [Tenacibaculum sp. SG-28]PQJ19604.1 tetrahydrofolate synthase [Tenacibaculum sp. SG-28]